MKFPIFETKIKDSPDFDLTDPEQRQAYFKLKAEAEIKEIRNYLKKDNTFIAYLLGKKNSGKGTYAKMFKEVVDPERVTHFSIGDLVRSVDQELRNHNQRQDLISFLKQHYRGYHSLDKILSSLKSRDTKTLLPTELILALVKREISRREKKAILIDGFPRDLDQVSYSLFFRDLIGYRYDPDAFVLISVPESVIDKRIKYRRVCPLCQNSRNLKLLPTNKVGYDQEKDEFYLICDNSGCPARQNFVGQNLEFDGARMVQKEGDALGIEPIRERLKKDQKLIKEAFALHGIPKILLRNAVPVKEASQYFNDYEITPEYNYQWDEENKKVEITTKPWQVKDDSGVPCYSLMPPPVVVSLIKQLVDVFNL